MCSSDLPPTTPGISTPARVAIMVLGVGAIVAALIYGSIGSEPKKEAAAPDPAAIPQSVTLTNTNIPVDPKQAPPVNELADSRMIISPPPDAAGIAPGTVVQGGFEGLTVASALPLFKTDPPRIGLDPPGPTTKVPVNTIDLFTGKPITFSSPKKMHKGYTVAFCCNNSAGYNGGWDSLTEAEKDTYVRSFLK